MKEQPTTRRGFSLIELLVVIAIMAILMAIIFPVLGSVRKTARRNACMGNLHDIATGLRMYRLDEGGYPIVLYGFYDVRGNNSTRSVVYGLYPSWVRDRSTFCCPNNPVLQHTDVEPAMQLVQTADGNPYAPGDWLTPGGRDDLSLLDVRTGGWLQSKTTQPIYPDVRFAQGDSYDVSVLPTKKVPNPIWERRYQRQWIASVDLSQPAPVGDPAAIQGWDTSLSVTQRRDAYAHQLVFRDPEDDTFVTSCTYHRDYPSNWRAQTNGTFPNDSWDVCLYLDGHVESRPTNQVYRYDQTGWAGWQVPGH